MIAYAELFQAGLFFGAGRSYVYALPLALSRFRASAASSNLGGRGRGRERMGNVVDIAGKNTAGQ